MTLSEYVKAKGYGALTKLMRASGLSYPTVLAASKGEPVKADTARRISAATHGAVPMRAMRVIAAKKKAA